MGELKAGENQSTGRLSNLEALRCVAMMMIVVLHFLGKGNVLGDLSKPEVSGYGYAAWVLECFCIVAVNAYMLLSGYFLSTSYFKLSRLIKLYLQIWFYSVLIGMGAYLFGIYPQEEFSLHYVLTLIFPITMGHYWFMTAYVFLYIFMPILSFAVRGMDKKQFILSLILLFTVFSLVKSILPARVEMDGQGYDVLWYICVFMAAAYIRKFGFKPYEKRGMSLILYLAGVLLCFGELMLLHMVYIKTGALEHIMKISIEYNHFFPFIASLGIVGVFKELRLPDGFGKFINRISPYTLGVYLLHENLGVRYAWQKLFGAADIDSAGMLILRTVEAVIVVFTVGIIFDSIRNFIFKGLNKLLGAAKVYILIKEKVDNVDKLCITNGQNRD
ncbi:MAG: acyltransferase [Lachnospiraceae bacterium]|nr:acyltransferase [Lachnospiraceae bacterium]